MKKGANSEKALNKNALSEALNTIDKVALILIFASQLCVSPRVCKSLRFCVSPGGKNLFGVDAGVKLMIAKYFLSASDQLVS